MAAVRASLDDPLAKLDWAEKHLTKLDAEIQAFYAGSVDEGQPYEVRSEFRPDTSEYVFWIEVVREPPLDLGLIFGDFVHNVRAGLDHLVCQLARLDNPASDCATTQFPITMSDTRFEELAPDYLRGVRDGHRAAVEMAQPYKSGKEKAPHHFLSLLAGLDNVDKHRVIHPTFGYFSDTSAQPDLWFVPNHDASWIVSKQIANGRRIKERKTEIVRIKLAPVGPDPQVKMHGDLVFEPAFGDRWMRADVLPKILDGARHIVRYFASDFRV